MTGSDLRPREVLLSLGSGEDPDSPGLPSCQGPLLQGETCIYRVHAPEGPGHLSRGALPYLPSPGILILSFLKCEILLAHLELLLQGNPALLPSSPSPLLPSSPPSLLFPSIASGNNSWGLLFWPCQTLTLRPCYFFQVCVLSLPLNF